MMADMDDFEIRGMIRLGQFLKLANLVDSGSDARELLLTGVVRVDGEVETRRGRQLVGGEVVEVGRAERVPARAGSGAALAEPFMICFPVRARAAGSAQAAK